MICKACGTVNDTALPARGSGWIELLLWLTFIIPIALAYSIWRRTNRRPACRACGSQDVVSLATPIGRRLAAEYHPGGLPLPAAVSTQPAPSLARRVGRALGIIAAGIVGAFVLTLVVGPMLG